MDAPQRKSSTRAYKRLFDKVTAVLFEADPVHINFGGNTDEYEPEARTIVARLKTCANEDDARRMIHEEFVRWFGGGIAGSEDSYASIAKCLWGLWRESALSKV